jgi:murein DD-endopeptidase MepM/ murein hydrolase activator NlpD
VQQDIRQIKEDKRLLEAQAQEQQALAVEFEARKAQYDADLKQEQQLLRDTQAARARAEDELDVMESEAEEMTGRIRALSALLDQRRRAEEAAWEAMHRRSGRAGLWRAESHFTDAPIWHGQLIRPVAGRITSGFGNRYHPILHQYRMHTGVDIGAPQGTPIHAAGAGTVILASYVRGYGNCIIIDHGDGLTTLYGHCSALAVSEGETVSQGQVIAYVGMTGLATGPHLHFEVRRNGVPVPPF